MNHTVICPDEACAAEFSVERSPEELRDEGELIACPTCGEEWEWDYSADTGLVLALPEEDSDLDDDEDDEEFEEDDEDEDEPFL